MSKLCSKNYKCLLLRSNNIKIRLYKDGNDKTFYKSSDVTINIFFKTKTCKFNFWVLLSLEPIFCQACSIPFDLQMRIKELFQFNFYLGHHPSKHRRRFFLQCQHLLWKAESFSNLRVEKTLQFELSSCNHFLHPPNSWQNRVFLHNLQDDHEIIQLIYFPNTFDWAGEEAFLISSW